MADFTLDSLRGGLDDFTPVSALAKDACTLAENVEFYSSTLGERRAGCAVPNAGLPVGITGDAILDAAVWMFHHQPTNSETNDELWVLTRDTDDTAKMYRLTSAGWTTVALNSVSSSDVPLLTNSDGYHIYGQSLHGKLFIAFRSGVDRLHVWDGTTLRRVGLAAHAAAPTVANGGGVGTYAAITRYYRTRSVVLSGSTVLLRSEPSASVSFLPDAAHINVTVTRPTAIGEGETHWEIEVSLDNATFYRLSRIAIATTTYADSAVTTTYSTNILSDPVGSYDLIPSVKYLLADDDRLITAADWTTVANGSAVRWTPVGTDPLPGPEERFNDTTDPRVDLDGLEAGDISGMKRAMSTVLVTKSSHVYNLIRTGDLVGAYAAQPVTKVRGALPRSLVEASDQAGRPIVYFIDPKAGPMRYGANGLEFAGFNVHTLWRRMNASAIVPCHGIYYPDKLQVHYWLALDGANYPNTKIVLQTNEVMSDQNGARRGWATVPSPARIADARCSCTFPIDIQAGTLTLVPFIGKATWTVGASTIRNVVQACDTGTKDADTTGDTGSSYTAKVRSRAFALEALPNRFGIDSGTLLVLAGSRLLLKLVRDYGLETIPVTVNGTAVGAETHVITQLDNLEIAEVFALEVQLEDDPNNLMQWQAFQLVLDERQEQKS